MPAEQHATAGRHHRGLEHQVVLVDDRVARQVDAPAILQGDRPGPDHPGPGQDPVNTDQLGGAEGAPIPLVREHRKRALAAEDLALQLREHRHLVARHRVEDGVKQGRRARLKQALDQEYAVDHVHHPATEPYPAATHLQLAKMAAVSVQPELTPGRREPTQVRRQLFVAARPVGHRDDGKRAACGAGLGKDVIGELMHRVDVAKLVGPCEVGEHRMLEQRPAHVGALHAADRAAKVELEQAEAGLIGVQVGAGKPADRSAPAAQGGRDLVVTRTHGSREGLEIAAEQPVWQAHHRRVDHRKVRVELLALRLADEQRPGQIPPVVDGVQQLRSRQRAEQIAGLGAPSPYLVQIQRGESGAVQHGWLISPDPRRQPPPGAVDRQQPTDAPVPTLITAMSEPTGWPRVKTPP